MPTDDRPRAWLTRTEVKRNEYLVGKEEAAHPVQTFALVSFWGYVKRPALWGLRMRRVPVSESIMVPMASDVWAQWRQERSDETLRTLALERTDYRWEYAA